MISKVRLSVGIPCPQHLLCGGTWESACGSGWQLLYQLRAEATVSYPFLVHLESFPDQALDLITGKVQRRLWVGDLPRGARLSVIPGALRCGADWELKGFSFFKVDRADGGCVNLRREREKEKQRETHRENKN